MHITRASQSIHAIVAFIVTITLSVSAQAESFEHQHLTLDLPTGWSKGTVPDGSQKETIGVLKSSSIPGTSITLDCYRGALHTQASTRIRGLNTIAAAYPDGQEHLQKPKKIKTRGGKGTVEYWRGYAKAGNITVKLNSPMAAVKTKHCWLVMIGFTPENTQDKLKQDFLAILKSAR